MKDQNNTFLDRCSLIYLSWFGTGYSPIAPGTSGSLATIPLIFFINLCNVNFYVFLTLLILVTIATCLITENIQKKYSVHDPSWIVADEVLGMLVTWSFVYPQFDLTTCGLVFIFFRIFDIVKIWPANFFDKKVHHGSGTILDDIVSGIYAGLLVLLAKSLLNIN